MSTPDTHLWNMAGGDLSRRLNGRHENQRLPLVPLERVYLKCRCLLLLLLPSLCRRPDASSRVVTRERIGTHKHTRIPLLC